MYMDTTKAIVEIVEVLKLASSIEPSIQQQVTHRINQLNSLPESAAYYSIIFGDPSINVDEEIRIRAGLLLKNMYQLILRNSHIDSTCPKHLEPEILDVIRPRALQQLTHPASALIRSTSVAIVSSIISIIGIHEWPEAVDHILLLLGSPDSFSFEAAFTGVMTIVEDGLETLPPLTQNFESLDPQNKAFVEFCQARLVPKLLQMAVDQTDETKQKKALSCLTNFVSHLSFAEGFFLESHFSDYWAILGKLGSMSSLSPELKRDVLAGMIEVLTFNETAVMNDGDAVLRFIIQCSKESDYYVRLQATDFFATAERSSCCLPLLGKYLREIVEALLENVRYSEADYMQMDASMFSPTNFNEPDLPQDIPPVHRPDEENDEADDEGYTYTMPMDTAWGNSPTLRKSSAGVLDHLAISFPSEVVEFLLPLVNVRTQSPDWEVRESVILALGAIAPSCITHLDEFVPQILQYIFKCNEDPTPLLRSISVWFIGRIFPWSTKLKHREEYSIPLMESVLKYMLDPNKKVQEASCSCFSVVEEEANELLIQILPKIVETFMKCFQIYQERNLLSLLDCCASLAVSAGPGLAGNQTIQPVVEEVMKRFQKMAIKDNSCVPIMEILTGLANSLGEGIIPYSSLILKKCCDILHRILRKLSSPKEHTELGAVDFVRLHSRHRDLLEGSVDVLAATIAACGTQAPLCMEGFNIMPLVELIITRSEINYKTSTRQYVYALVGDIARFNPIVVEAYIPSIVPSILSSIVGGPTLVTNNAAWAIGEMCMNCNQKIMLSYASPAAAQLCRLLKHSHISHISVLRNAALTLGRIAAGFPMQVVGPLSECMEEFSRLLSSAANDHDKAIAISGLCKVISSNPQAAKTCFFQILELFGSIYLPPPPDKPGYPTHVKTFTPAPGIDVVEISKTLQVMKTSNPQLFDSASQQLRPQTLECLSTIESAT
eukprot:GHVP01024173.1.p1 GENE.GHVP01024173.1~~GHVP01024173.1.p1  ORF type:complete len:948 (-),score=146.54 GHVP01024173.1:6235-9078(-)